MPISNPPHTRDRLVAFSRDSAVVNIHAQAQARAILKRTDAPTTDWPNFDPNLDERLHHIAHRLIWGALELLQVDQFQEDAKTCLVQGAEALEFLYGDSSMPVTLRTEELLKASFAYYIGGHGARAFVLLNDTLESFLPVPPMLQLAVGVLQKNLRGARQLTIDLFGDDAFLDNTVADQLDAGEINIENGLGRIITRSTARAVCCFLEYVKSGHRDCFNEAVDLIEHTIDLARESRFVDLWWWAFCIRFMFREFDDNCFWTLLNPFTGDEDPNGLVHRYVLAALRQSPPVIDLWHSQRQAISTIASSERPDFCLRMPTSAGKTRIAELTILRFLLDNRENPDAKCMYIAPFRSLAVEVEKSLRRSIEPLGEGISEVYGGFELSPAERTEVAKNRVLVATPEKFDALLRFVPELADQLRLVIFDEGHIVDPNQRGLRFELLIQRSIKRFRKNGCRFLFISAVLPNAEQFAEWITTSPNNLVQSNWRPSRLMLGRLDWDGQRIGIRYTNGQQALPQECFIRRFVDTRECRGIPGLGQRRKPFPRDFREATAAAALAFAQDGTTLVFVPQARQVDAAAKDLREALDCLTYLSENEGTQFTVPVPGRDSETWVRCKRVIQEEMGNESNLLDYFVHGIAVHHAQLPRRVRLAIEDAIREGAARIIVATTTLAQGVNLPIKTVVVRGLYHGHGDVISPLTFWNVCGRAGRAMKENEGQILFCSDQKATINHRRKHDQAINTVIQTLQSRTVLSALRLALQMILTRWRETHSAIDIAALSLSLAENDVSWAIESQRQRLESWLDILDGHLLALTEEFEMDADSPDRLQEILEGSLLFLQLRDQPIPNFNADNAVKLLHSRVRYVFSRLPEKSVRTRMYKLGMTLSSSFFVEDHRDDLTNLLKKANDWDDWEDEQRSDFLTKFASVLLDIRDIRPDNLPGETNTIMRRWLMGENAAEMAADPTLHGFSDDPSEIALLIENVCGYRVPWGANSVLAYLTDYMREAGEDPSAVCGYFSAMFKYGLVSPTATCIAPRVDQRRDLATAAATVCPHHYAAPDRVIAWFMNVSAEGLIGGGLEPATATAVIEARDALERARKATASQRRHETIRLRFNDVSLPEDVDRLRRIIVYPDVNNEPRRFDVYSLSGVNLGVFRLQKPIPDWWQTGDLAEAVITNIDQTDTKIIVDVEIREL